jgi:hypothetical protein
MNPLNPWVALFEMLFLLGAAFALGWGIAYLRYRKPIQTQQQAIDQLQQRTKPFLTTDE